MQKKIPVKTLYLLLVISIGLIGLGVGSTFAMFTATAEINNPISISSDLAYSNDIVETVDVNIPAGQTKTITLNITNNTSSSLNYTTWYIDSNNVDIGKETESSPNTIGTLSSSNSVSVKVKIRNNEDSNINIVVGVSSNTGSVVLGNNMQVVPNKKVEDYTPLSDFIYAIGSYGGITNYNNNNVETTVGSEYDLGFDQPFSIPNGEIYLINYKGVSDKVIIPDAYEINGSTYTPVIFSLPIGIYGTFQYNTNITSVRFSDNTKFVYYVGPGIYSQLYGADRFYNVMNYVFYGCKNLQNVYNIPESVTEMSNTFEGCSNLESISNIPNSVTKMVSTFYGCTQLESVPPVPESVTDISEAFFGCGNLTEVVIKARNIEFGNILAFDTYINSDAKNINIVVPSDYCQTYDSFKYLIDNNYLPKATLSYLTVEPR